MRHILLAALMIAPAPALASQCYSLSQDMPGVRYVAYEAPEVVIRYIAHSTFRIETPDGVVIATDFSGFWGGGEPPDVVTMNHAHETHYTDWPDPRIGLVLRGWNDEGPGPAEHQVQVGDVLIRNVATNIRDWDGGTEVAGNSIFIFEVADLCIGHLGHLHHQLTPAHLALIGRLDVVMAPVDGSYTLDTPAMIEVLKALRARLVLPMHAFGNHSMRRFVEGMQDDFAVVSAEGDTIRLSVTSLPREPTVLVLPAR